MNGHVERQISALKDHVQAVPLTWTMFVLFIIGAFFTQSLGSYNYTHASTTLSSVNLYTSER